MNRLPNLDECVLGALELFKKQGIPKIELPPYERPLVVGSGNAAVTGRILFEDTDAVFADESNFRQKLSSAKGVDGCILISASGGKHAPLIAEYVKSRGLPVVLLTNNPEAPAAKLAERTHVFPKQPEPYTYNTSTYLGMILGKTKEEPEKIAEHLLSIDPVLSNGTSAYDAFFFIVPERFDNIREMILTKGSELFGSKLGVRAFTPEQTKHAKTVVPSDSELFVGIGYDNRTFGKNRLNVPLPMWADYGTVMATCYYIVGRVQRDHRPYFMENIERYARETSAVFGQEIKPVVE